MLPRLRFALLVAIVLFAGVAARAQIGVYGMGSGGFLGSTSASEGSLVLHNGGFSAYGGTFGVYDNFLSLGPLKVGADGRFFVQSSSNSNSYGNKLHGGLGGVRLALRLPAVPLSPYVQAEIGGVGTNYGTQANTSGSFAYQIQGGLDFTIFPRLDLRGEYGGGQIDGVFNGTKATMQQVGVGLVLRL